LETVGVRGGNAEPWGKKEVKNVEDRQRIDNRYGKYDGASGHKRLNQVGCGKTG